MAGRLDGKVAIITGSGGSIGRACCLGFAAEGARVVGTDLNPDWAEETVDLVTSAGGEMVSQHPCDLTDPEQVQAMVDLATSTYGRVDAIYNNAGTAWFNWMDDITFEDW